LEPVPLDAEGARRFYDRLGRWQDTQRLYEHAATRRLVRGASLGTAHSVFELGCGTGRFAAGLLRDELAGDARYVGVDVSPVMVAFARDRLAPWTGRAEVRLLEAPARALAGADGSFDRFLATYVFDLLSDDDSRALIGEARRLLAPAGLLGLVSLTHGTTTASKALSGVWGALATRSPELVGGCRPIELQDLLDSVRWALVRREVVTRWGVPSEVIVAARREGVGGECV
jgi:ubiquinone/menaquinone biosynthesis C-methylase UbiE